ncbi:hypothetical protein ID867_22865 [Streptomyces parvulus]|nr:hypothetical protein [Streptomyces parvulus]
MSRTARPTAGTTPAPGPAATAAATAATDTLPPWLAHACAPSAARSPGPRSPAVPWPQARCCSPHCSPDGPPSGSSPRSPRCWPASTTGRAAAVPPSGASACPPSREPSDCSSGRTPAHTWGPSR